MFETNPFINAVISGENPPDISGATWLEELDPGVSREVLVDLLLDTAEWDEDSQKYLSKWACEEVFEENTVAFRVIKIPSTVYRFTDMAIQFGVWDEDTMTYIHAGWIAKIRKFSDNSLGTNIPGKNAAARDANLQVVDKLMAEMWKQL